MDLQRQQALLAKFLDDPDFEESLRRSPEKLALQHGIDRAYVRRLARLDRHRVEAFRRGQRRKAARRKDL